MNLRTLKKLSKRAAPLLAPLGDTRKQFFAERCVNYHKTVVRGGHAHPLKGTPMVGSVTGYYEPEWDEETAWDSLRDIVYWHFTDWDGEDLVPTRTFRRPSDIIRAGREMAEARS